jgi:hypothetical protein
VQRPFSDIAVAIGDPAPDPTQDLPEKESATMRRDRNGTRELAFCDPRIDRGPAQVCYPGNFTYPDQLLVLLGGFVWGVVRWCHGPISRSDLCSGPITSSQAAAAVVARVWGHDAPATVTADEYGPEPSLSIPSRPTGRARTLCSDVVEIHSAG